MSESDIYSETGMSAGEILAALDALDALDAVEAPQPRPNVHDLSVYGDARVVITTNALGTTIETFSSTGAALGIEFFPATSELNRRYEIGASIVRVWHERAST